MELGGDYKVLNGLQVKAGAGAQEFDHLVVGPGGIFHIESKNWGGTVTFTDHGVDRSSDGPKEDPTAALYRHEYWLKELLRANKLQADLVGILCFSNPECKVVGGSPAFQTVKLDQLAQTIKSYKPKHKLTAADVKTIVRLLEESGNVNRKLG